MGSMADDLSARGQAVLDASLARAVRPATVAVGLGYLASGLVHFAFGGPHEHVLPALELASAIFLLALYLRDTRNARVRTAVLGAVILANNAVFHSINDAASHTPVLYLLVLGAGIVAGIPRFDYVALLGGTFVVQWFAIARSPDPLEAWVEPAITLVAAFVLSITLRYHAREHLSQITQLEAQRAASHAAHEATLSHFRDVAETTRDLIAELDDRGRVVYANPAHREIFRVASEEGGGGDPFADLRDELAAQGIPPLRAFLEGPIGPIELEIPGEPGGRDRVILELSSRPFETADGEQRVVMTSRDVTRRAEQAAEDERYRQQLEAEVESRTRALTASVIALQRRERLASVGTLAAGIAHQINNPIGGILLSSEFALKEFELGTTDAEGLANALDVNLEEARRCGEIVKHLLRFAQNETAERQVIDLAPTIERVANLCRPYAASREGVIRVDVPARKILVSANPVEIEESLINLIRNAVESRDKSATVEIELSADATKAEILVADDGPGIPEDQQGHVFDPFYTTRLREGGTGLGLSVARDIAIDHGGSLEIEGNGERGTRIRVTLPLDRSTLD